MRKSLALFALALAAAQAWSGQSWAADLRFPAGPGYYPPPSPPPGFFPGPRWTGCYVGGNLGGAWANINESASPERRSPRTLPASPAAARSAAMSSSTPGCLASAT